MKLYYAPRTISVAVAIALEEAELAYELIPVDFAEGQQTGQEYLSLNPKGRVPLLITDAGKRLTETGALLDYVAALAPAASLVPADCEEAAHMRSVMYYLASTMHVNHAHKLRGHRWATLETSFADMRAKVAQTMTDSATYVETDCLRGDYILGDAFSLADPYTFMVCTWLEGDGVTLADFPRISAYLERMRTRASVQAVTAKGLL